MILDGDFLNVSGSFKGTKRSLGFLFYMEIAEGVGNPMNPILMHLRVRYARWRAGQKKSRKKSTRGTKNAQFAPLRFFFVKMASAP